MRFMVFRKIKRLQCLVSLKQPQNYYSTVRGYGPFLSDTLRSSFKKFYGNNKVPGSHVFYTPCKSTENPFKSICNRHFSSSSTSSYVTYHGHVAWRRLSSKWCYGRVASAQISGTACAVSLACSRYHIVPRVLALIFGELAWSQMSFADGEYLPLRHNLMRDQDLHMHITSYILVLLEVFILVIRAIYLAILLSPAIAMAPFADSFGDQFRRTWLHVVHATLERAGPAFIKWGQWAATRPDLFPSDLCAELAKLHSKAPEHSFAYTKETVENAFGRKLSEIFDSFDEVPVASGSVAQVHRASLTLYPGKQNKPMVVAVKVRHPGVGELIKRDFAIINTVAKISKFIPTLNWLRLDESVQQFAVFMMSQVDLAREAAHLSRFIYNFRWSKDVSFPKPLYPLVHPAVLVETYEHGESVSHYVDDIQGHDRLKSTLAHIGTHALLKMLLVDNFIHADMHPGNILVRVPPTRHPSKSRRRPHVVFLDVGMTAELTNSDRVNLLEFFKAVALRDGRTAAECTLRLSQQQTCPNPRAFIEEVEKSFTFWGTREGDVVHPAECMHQLLEQVRRHKVNIDGSVCTVMVTTLVLEGWQRKLDPDYNVMQALKSLLFKVDWVQSLSYTIEALMSP
ncbi:hypothetical protein Taro_028281 [Colocasia esculenta]|uniref:ABC1 atypical kinase-like domain-containing protein n=1 Tax=Colocasia esculenta TaxID=4460 RepID=A0A843VQ01_COLES|nr:hypothetical protein [Colocasia esculenta]